MEPNGIRRILRHLIRAEALTRPPVVVYRCAGSESGGLRLPVGPEHPAQQLLERVNRWYTRADLWRATEIYLNLWGSAYWMLDRDAVSGGDKVGRAGGGLLSIGDLIVYRLP